MIVLRFFDVVEVVSINLPVRDGEPFFWATDHAVETAVDLECAGCGFAIRAHPNGAFAFEACQWECWILGGDALAGCCDLSFR
jgi:hypothetical protein